MRRAVSAAVAVLALAAPAAAHADRFSLDDPPPFASGSEVTLTGNVTTQDGAPLPGRDVFLRGRPAGGSGNIPTLQQTKADGNGGFRFTLKLSEPYELQAGDGNSDWGNSVTATPTAGGPPPGGVTLDAPKGAIWPQKTTVTGKAAPGSHVTIQTTPHPYTASFTTAATATAGPDGRYSAQVKLDRRAKIRAVLDNGQSSPEQLASLTPGFTSAKVKRLPGARFRVTVIMQGPPALKVPKAWLYVGPVKAKRLRRVGTGAITKLGPGTFQIRKTLVLRRLSSIHFCFPLAVEWRTLNRTGTIDIPSEGTTNNEPAEVTLVGSCGLYTDN